MASSRVRDRHPTMRAAYHGGVPLLGRACCDREPFGVEQGAVRAYARAVHVVVQIRPVVIPADDEVRAVERDARALLCLRCGRDRDRDRIEHRAVLGDPLSEDVVGRRVPPDDEVVRAVERDARTSRESRKKADAVRIEHSPISRDAPRTDIERAGAVPVRGDDRVLIARRDRRRGVLRRYRYLAPDASLWAYVCATDVFLADDV